MTSLIESTCLNRLIVSLFGIVRDVCVAVLVILYTQCCLGQRDAGLLPRCLTQYRLIPHDSHKARSIPGSHVHLAVRLSTWDHVNSQTWYQVSVRDSRRRYFWGFPRRCIALRSATSEIPESCPIDARVSNLTTLKSRRWNSQSMR